MELLAWFLLIIGAIIGAMLLLPIGYMFLFLFVMSFDAPNSTQKPQVWLMNILMLGIAIGLASLIPIAVYFAYGAIQQGHATRSVLIMSIVVSPLILAISYYLYKTRSASQKYDAAMEEQKLVDAEAKAAEMREAERIAKEREMAINAIHIFKNEEIGICTLAMNDDFEYKNISTYVYLRAIDKLKLQANGKNRIYTKWKKEASILNRSQAVMLDFNNLDDNKPEDEYLIEIQSESVYLTSFMFQKKDGDIHLLEIGG